jgi:hypothetical protein
MSELEGFLLVYSESRLKFAFFIRIHFLRKLCNMIWNRTYSKYGFTIILRGIF